MFKKMKLSVSLVLALCLALLVITPAFADPTVVDLFAGRTYDIYRGNCGAYIQTASTWGTATLDRVEKTGGFAFAHDPCELSFVNTAGTMVSNFGAPITYYFNLQMELYNKFQNDKVKMFVNDGTGWRPCNTVLVGVDLENGDYGRLACTVNSVGRFAIGYTNK